MSQAMVIDLLLAAGWREAGATRTEHVRIPTSKVPVYGNTGGERRTLGGRPRFDLPDTDRRVTVGPKTTSFYRVDGRLSTDFKNFDTKNVDAIGAWVTA
jgi:hypothetical protein